MRILLLLILTVSVARADTTLIFEQGVGSENLGVQYSWDAPAYQPANGGTYVRPPSDFQSEDPHVFLDGVWDAFPSLTALIPDATFTNGYTYTFKFTGDGGGLTEAVLVSIDDGSEPPEDPTLQDWFWAGWNFLLLVMGFALSLRAVKGLRGPGSGEL